MKIEWRMKFSSTSSVCSFNLFFFFCLFTFFFFCSSTGYAEPGYQEVKKGNQAFLQANYDEAINQYEQAAVINPEQALIDYNLGVARYKKGDFVSSVEHLQKSLLVEDEEKRLDVHYNLGNAFYGLGLTKENQDAKDAILNLKEAVRHYEQGLQINKEDADAIVNRDFVLKEIKRLEKKLQQQQKSSTNKNNNDGESSEGKQQGQEQQGQEREEGQKQASQQGNEDQGQQSSNTEEGGEESQSQSSQETNETSEKKDSEQRQGQKPGEGDEKQDPSSGQQMSAEIVSQKEAQMLLDRFDQNEQPRGLLNFIQKTVHEKSVDKDW